MSVRIVVLALVLAGCAADGTTESASAAGELDRALGGRVAGDTRQCVSLSRIDGPRIIGETILYRDGPRLWRSDVPDGCPALRGDPIIVVETHGGQVCRNDRFRTLMRGASTIPGPYCRFGDFTPYVKPKS